MAQEMERIFAEQRERMVEQQIRPRGIKDSSVLEAMRTVPRHLFVPEASRIESYRDGPLPIAEGQTISQPYIVALMTQSAQIDQYSRVLDVGTGSGYAAAVFSRIAKEVISIERIGNLAKSAEKLFQDLNYDNIRVVVGDGSQGCKKYAPYDAIVVTAGSPEIPRSLCDQLKSDGCLVIPVGDAKSQNLLRVKSVEGKLKQEVIESVRFVPLIGQEGWKTGGPSIRK